MRGIADRGAAIRIGALVRHADVLESALIARARAAAGAWRSRMSRIWPCAIAARRCGSLALADPSAEMPAVAVALNADIVLQKRGATRTVAARDFFQGLYQTARDDDEMIVGGRCSRRAKPDEVFGFSELSRRHGDFATVGVAMRARKTPRGLARFRDRDFRLRADAACSVASAAKLTLDTGVADAALADMAHDIAKEMNPIESHQGRGDTKRKQAAVLLQRVLEGHDRAGRACLSTHDIAFTLNGKPVAPRSRRACIWPTFCATRCRLHRNPCRLRARRLRRVQRHDRRTLGAKLPDAGGPGRRRQCRDHRGADGAQRHRRSAGGVRGPQRAAMRLLHARHARDRGRIARARQADPGAKSARPCPATSAAAPAIRRSSMRSKRSRPRQPDAQP